MKKQVLSFFRYATLLLAIPVGGFQLYINLTEAIDRSRGKMTVLSQISPLSDSTTITYCQASFIFYLVLLLVLGGFLLSKKNGAVVIVSLIIILATIVQLVLEDAYIYYDPI